MKRRDSEIRAAVVRELMEDPRIEGAEIAAHVTSGVVALTGTVGSWGIRLAAQEAAHRVVGVLDVANDIQVNVLKNEWRADSELALSVRVALECEVAALTARIQSTVSDGHVTLDGCVHREAQRDAAERAVGSLYGVRSVLNRIEVRPASATARAVWKSVEAALVQRAEHAARAIDVVMSDDDTAVLSGPVRSWAERESVIGAAKATPGVRHVDARLFVER